MIRSALIAALTFAAAVPVLAQDVESAPASADRTDAAPETDEDSIVVIGRRPEGVSVDEYLLDFVAEIGDPPSPHVGYARWRGRACVGVVNIAREAAQFIADRVSAVALEVGLSPGEPGCRPNIVIVFARDGRSLASQLVETAPHMFRPFGGQRGTTQGLSALDEFATSDAPVRWWQITMVVDRAGQVALEVPTSGEPPTIGGGSNSRITNTVSDDLWATYVIVDVTKLGHVEGTQLADYLAMVALAQVDPGAHPAGYDSILNLFQARSPASGMTALDHSYLRALYAMDTLLVPRLQRRMLVATMLRNQRQSSEGE